MYFASKLYSVIKPVILPAVAFLLGAIAMYYWFSKTPVKTVTKTEVVEKIVEKEKIVYKQSSDKNTNTSEKRNIETRTITRPDGTIETVTVDRSTTETASNESTSVESSKETEKSQSKITKNSQTTVIKKDWMIGVSLHTDATNASSIGKESITFQAEISRNLLGPVWASIFYNHQNNKNIGMGISIEF